MSASPSISLIPINSHIERHFRSQRLDSFRIGLPSQGRDPRHGSLYAPTEPVPTGIANGRCGAILLKKSLLRELMRGSRKPASSVAEKAECYCVIYLHQDRENFARVLLIDFFNSIVFLNRFAEPSAHYLIGAGPLPVM
jgi:hypothetical protein